MTAKSSYNGSTLADFDKLLIGDSDEINLLQNEFESNGWCFIQLPDQNGQLTKKINEVQTTLRAFFSRDQMDKSQYQSSNDLGYSRVDHKEGIKVLIDQYGLQNDHPPLTNDVERALQYLAILFDNLTGILKSIIFKMPVFAQSPAKASVSLSHLGMLDIVHYFNERIGPVKQPDVGLNTHEVNCVPHFDPGLFSLSILSTCDGLQLKDQLKQKWIDGPNNFEYGQSSIGVIWLGEAASILTENRFKSGIHRVVYPRIPHQSRLTIWQEVCTEAQIKLSVQQDGKDICIPGGIVIQMSNQPNSRPLRVRTGGESIDEFMKKIERRRGLSASKSPSIRRSRDLIKKRRLLTQQQTDSNLVPGDYSVTVTNRKNSASNRVQLDGTDSDDSS